MLFATLDVDLPDDPLFIALEEAGEAWPWWWIRLIQVGKRHNRRGRLCHSDGRPLVARDMALVHHRSIQRTEEWQRMLDACLDLGLLAQDDDGAYRIADWRRWHRSPSDDPEAIRERVSRHRARSHEDVTPVTTCNGCNDTEQSRAEQRQSRAEQQQSMGNGLAAAAGPDEYLAPGPGLESLRPAIGQAMQALGLMGSPSGTWWTSVTAWAAPAIDDGATLDDVRDAMRYGTDKAAHDRPRRPWPYAMAIAAEEIGQISRRNQMRRDWEAGGRRGPEPLPYIWTPQEETCSR